MTSDYCRIHQVPMLFKRMNGGWTTVCPWCDAMGKYERVGAHEAAHGYPRNNNGQENGNGVQGTVQGYTAPVRSEQE